MHLSDHVCKDVFRLPVMAVGMMHKKGARRLESRTLCKSGSVVLGCTVSVEEVS